MCSLTHNANKLELTHVNKVNAVVRKRTIQKNVLSGCKHPVVTKKLADFIIYWPGITLVGNQFARNGRYGLLYTYKVISLLFQCHRSSYYIVSGLFLPHECCYVKVVILKSCVLTKIDLLFLVKCDTC